MAEDQVFPTRWYICKKCGRKIPVLMAKNILTTHSKFEDAFVECEGSDMNVEECGEPFDSEVHNYRLAK